MEKYEKLAKILADGCYHSGQSLARELGVSRTAIWKHLQKLRRLGADIHAIRGRGYQMKRGIDMLDADAIRDDLGDAVLRDLAEIEVCGCVDSTSDRLSHPSTPVGQVCIAECQTRGRGRRGRSWVSPYGTNIYLSLRWAFQRGLPEVGAVGLVAALAILDAIEQVSGARLAIKWPNDILFDGKKLAGILVDASGEANGPVSCVIGLGVNVRLSEADHCQIDQAATDLVVASAVPLPSRNQLIASMLNQLLPALRRYEQDGFMSFTTHWKTRDALRGRRVNLLLANETIEGYVHGIDNRGALLLESGSVVRAYNSGEISLRVADETSA